MLTYSLLALAALATSTIAAPHAHGHHHVHARTLKLAPLAGRELSNNGECGGAQGLTCGAGYCCSEWGYCGNDVSYCGAGCQSAFGTCNTTSSAATSAVVHTAAFTRPAHTWSAGWTASTSVYSTVTTSSSAQSSTAAIPSTTSASEASASSVSASAAAPTSPAETQTSASASTTTFATSVATTSVALTTTDAPTSPSSSAPAPTSTSSSGSSGSGAGDSYTVYSGDGTTAEGWPSQDSWAEFDSMWSSNMAYISISCTQFGESNNSPQESDDLKSAIQSVATSSGVDARFILAVVMQESKGCVRAPTTNYGVNNPGLMQSHDGSGSCNIGGTIQDPCPSSEIVQMIEDGSTGTSAGDGLSQLITQTGASDVSKFYKASRMYNSGSLAASGNLQDGIATHCYSSDIANRLTGWVKATTKCTFD